MQNFSAVRSLSQDNVPKNASSLLRSSSLLDDDPFWSAHGNFFKNLTTVPCSPSHNYDTQLIDSPHVRMDDNTTRFDHIIFDDYLAILAIIAADSNVVIEGVCPINIL